MAYGASEEEAARKVKSIALQVLADMIENGEGYSEQRSVEAVWRRWTSQRQGRPL
jgi:hypothetical protein